MVTVTPYRYIVRRDDGRFPGVSFAVLCDLYLVAGTAPAFDPFRESWLVHAVAYHQAHRGYPLPGAADVRAGSADVARWTAAQQAVLTELRDAERQLIDDHGMVEVRHSPSARSLGGAPGPRAFLRRLRTTRRRSGRAFQRYQDRIGRAAAAYEPVRDEITARVREAHQRAREQWDRMRAVAARPWWSYRVDREARVVHILHEEGSTWDTPGLAEHLLEVRRETGISALRWAPGAREEVERDSGADFVGWWRSFTEAFWRDPEQIPNTRRTPGGSSVHVSAHTSFTGMDSFGSFGVL